jgi:hypothetical protein
MEFTRRELVLQLLTCRLELEALKGSFTPVQRVAWLARMLTEYLDRLEGALQLPGWTLESLRGGDTVGIVDIGIEVLAAEIARTDLAPKIVSAWAHLRADWASFRSGGDAAAAADLRQQVASIYAALGGSG